MVGKDAAKGKAVMVKRPARGGEGSEDRICTPTPPSPFSFVPKISVQLVHMWDQHRGFLSFQGSEKTRCSGGPGRDKLL